MTTPNPGWWLRVPGLGLNLKLDVEFQDIPYSDTQPQGEFAVEGRANPVIRQGTRSGLRWSLPVRTTGEAQWEELLAALRSSQVMLLEASTGESWYVVAGSMSGTWSAGHSSATTPVRITTLPLIETDPPL